MSATVLYMSMSLDGFIAGPNEGPGNGLGDGGDRLHEWVLANADPDADLVLGGHLTGANAQVFGEVRGALGRGRGRRDDERLDVVELAGGAVEHLRRPHGRGLGGRVAAAGDLHPGVRFVQRRLLREVLVPGGEPGDPLRCGIAYFLGIPLDFLLRFEVHPASLSVVELGDWGAKVLCVNDRGGELFWAERA